jgi:hypothetical protein
LLQQLRASLGEDHAPDLSDVAKLYAEAGVVLPDMVRHRFDEVERFHRSIIKNRRTNIPTILYGLVPWPHLPGVAELPAASKHVVHLASSTSHQLLAKLVYAPLALHLGAVAKHQLLDRDEVFAHMAVGARPGWREPRLWLAAAGLFAAIAFGIWITPRVKIKTIAPAAPVASAPAATVTPPPTPVSPSLAPAAVAAPKEKTAKIEAPLAWMIESGSTLGFATAWSGQPIQGSFKRWDGDIVF